MQIDLRVIAATNKDLDAMVADGSFRADLYHRISCLKIVLPPLRARPSDILLLAAYFLEEHAPSPLNETVRISHRTARMLTSYHWPGNVRQLRNAILAATTRTAGDLLDPEHFDAGIADFLAGGAIKPLWQVEKEHISRVLAATDGNKRKAAKLLGISPQTLYSKIVEYGINTAEKTRNE